MNEIQRKSVMLQRVTFHARIVTSTFTIYFLAVLYLFFFFAKPWGMWHLSLVFSILGGLSLLTVHFLLTASSDILRMATELDNDDSPDLQHEPLASLPDIALLATRILWIVTPLFTCASIAVVVFKEITTTKALVGILMLLVYFRCLLFIMMPSRSIHSHPNVR